MASFTKRLYSTWRIVSAAEPSLNKTFLSKSEAQVAARELERETASAVKVVPVSSIFWQVRIRSKGLPTLCKNFPRKDLAEDWAKLREGEIAKRQFVDYRAADRTTLGDLLRRYATDRLPGRTKQDPDTARIGMLCRHSVAAIRMSVLQSSDISSYRDERCKLVAGASVTKELELIARIIAISRSEWGIHLAANVASGRLVRRPEPEDGDERDRRLTEIHKVDQHQPSAREEALNARRKRPDVDFETDPDTEALLAMPHSEQQALLRACRYPHWYTERKAKVTAATIKARLKRAAKTRVKARCRPGCRVWAVASFAIETAIRRGEIVKLTWAQVHVAEGHLLLPRTMTKNRKPRLVPLTLRAQRILATLPRVSDRVFATNANSVKLAFRRALERARCTDLRLHDLRHEATSRLFERTTLRETEIGYVTGHTDARMLQRYYNKRPAEFVQRFRESFK